MARATSDRVGNRVKRQMHDELVELIKPHIVRRHPNLFLLEDRVDMFMGDEHVAEFDLWGLMSQRGRIKPYVAEIKTDLNGYHSRAYENPVEKNVEAAQKAFRYHGPIPFEMGGVRASPSGNTRTLVLFPIEPRRTQRCNLRKDPLKYMKDGEVIATINPMVGEDYRRPDRIEYNPALEIGVRH